MPRPVLSTARLMILVASLLTSGCTIQDVFRSTMGGINSDQASLNKVNPSNEYSFPHDDDRTVWRMPNSKQ